MVSEDDFPPGHPKRFDYDPSTLDAKEWARKHIHPRGERDFPVDSLKAVDTPGNLNSLEWRAGVDPTHPDLEPFTGRTADQARAVLEFNAAIIAAAKPTPSREPIDAEGFLRALHAECVRLNIQELSAEQYEEFRARWDVRAA